MYVQYLYCTPLILDRSTPFSRFLICTYCTYNSGVIPLDCGAYIQVRGHFIVHYLSQWSPQRCSLLAAYFVIRIASFSPPRGERAVHIHAYIHSKYAIIHTYMCFRTRENTLRTSLRTEAAAPLSTIFHGTNPLCKSAC